MSRHRLGCAGLLGLVAGLLALSRQPAALFADGPAPTARPVPARWVLGAYVRGPDRLVAGTEAALRIAVHWASSETESGPLPGAEVTAALVGGGRRVTLFRGRSDGAGVVDGRFTVPSWPDGRYAVEVEASRDGRREASDHAVELVPGAKVLLESDKPLYQPGQAIHLRAIAARAQDGRPIADRKVRFTLRDPRGNRVFHVETTTSRFGVAATDLRLADEILLGDYGARAELVGDAGTPGELELTVERYALPKLKLGLRTDRPFYTPGQRLRFEVDARYFFGKAVARGEGRLVATVDGAPRLEQRVGLDEQGRGHGEIDLPTPPGDDDRSLRLTFAARDSAGHEEKITREVLLARHPYRFEVTAEAGVLLPGVENRMWVAVVQPDGSPAIDLSVGVTVDQEPLQALRTNALGVATWSHRPLRRRDGGSGCGRDQVAVRVATAAAAEPLLRCVGLARDGGGLVLRPDRALYPAGAPLRLDVESATTDGTAYVDVIRDGQIVDTAAVPLQGGRGQILLPADERRFGTLALRAYQLAPDGRASHDARLVYVERPSSLKIDVLAQGGGEGGVFRPGESGQLRFKVVDSVSGRPAEASVGVVMVDQALLALRAVRPGAARTFFTLTREATRPHLKRTASPGGYTVEQLVEGGAADELRQEAARILLAGAAPPWQLGWQVDPWLRRRERRDEQLRRLGTALARYTRDHNLGERIPGSATRWRYRSDLLVAMVQGGALPGRELRDPWARPVENQAAIEAAELGTFDQLAGRQIEARFTAIYRALGRDRRLAADPAPLGKRKQVLLTDGDLARLGDEGKVPKGQLLDPWGTPFRIENWKRPQRFGGLWSRQIVVSSGPDGRPGTADDRLPVDYGWDGGDDLLVGAVLRGEVRGTLLGARGMTLSGVGYGGGGVGLGTIGLGRLGTIGHGGGGGGEEARVRRDFPETMLWRPEVVTDSRGEATVEVTMADSVTTWRLTAEAIAADGRIGFASTDVRVFQDFFVDLDLPPTLSQNDEVAVPVAVYNYLPTRQRIELTLDDTPGVERRGEAVQRLELGPAEVGVRHFRVVARGVGRRTLKVRARGDHAADAVERGVEVFPDGVERAVAFQDQLVPGAVQHQLTIPADAIADASVTQLKLYPAPVSHVIEGLDSMLRMPSGCFEQTSSSTYPNALILDYLRRQKKATPELEKRALDYLSLGYQRLLSFEVKGGGFSWFGDAPANQILTAYGLEEFHDMARVFPVDPRLIERTRAWLLSRQRSDGSWAPDTRFINEGATNRFNSDVVRITAYIAWVLGRAGERGPALDRARGYVRRHLAADERDPYTLALAASLFGADDATAADELMERLWQLRHDEAKASSFAAAGKTLTYGDGRTATVETTAMATTAMLTLPRPLFARLDRTVNYLLGAKDSFGSWHSTQSTIRSLQALLTYQRRRAAAAKGTVTIKLEGEAVAGASIDGGDETVRVISIPAATRPGRHTVAIEFRGEGALAYQLVGRYYEPRRDGPRSADEELVVRTRFDRTTVAVGDRLHQEVRVRSRTALDMPMITAGLPPGFEVDGEALDELVRRKVVEKVQRTPREVVFYLRRLEAGGEVGLVIPLTARLPSRVQAPASTAWEYYRPERRSAANPVLLTVDG